MPKDKVAAEDEYFHREEQEKLARLKAAAVAEEAAAALKARKDAHFHKCGKCGADMATELFKGVEIEICGECGGVLLDAGELQALAGRDESSALQTIGDLFNFSKRKRKG